VRFVVPAKSAARVARVSLVSAKVSAPSRMPSTVACEATVKHFASEAMKGKPLFEGPLWLSVTVWVLHPQSWSKKRKASAVYVTGKPDCDNVLKLIGDALNGIVWVDDAQLADAHIVRKFTTEAERVEIELGRCGFELAMHPMQISEAA
jgi:Holliday junction resolvase RusA-like endonuclease